MIFVIQFVVFFLPALIFNFSIPPDFVYSHSVAEFRLVLFLYVSRSVCFLCFFLLETSGAVNYYQLSLRGFSHLRMNTLINSYAT